MQATEHIIEVWGELACFTRPELKVERFSYPVITPSAARGIFDAIYCKPNRDPTQAQFRWQIARIEVLKEPRYIALRRNEVKDKISVPNVNQWMKNGEWQPILADGTAETLGSDAKGRTQRQTVALREVRYRLHAKLMAWPGHEQKQKALEAQFVRRAASGKCFYQPYFGCREFPAYFELCEPGSPRPEQAWQGNVDVGLMLYDVFDMTIPGTDTSQQKIRFFHAQVCDGVLEVPDPEDDMIFRIGKEVTL